VSDAPGAGPAPPRTRRASLAAVALALACAVAGAVLWGLAAVVLGRQLLLAGLLIGIGAGYAVARLRPGHWPTITAGAVLTICGCALGTLLALIFVPLSDHVSAGTVLGHLGTVLRIYPSAVGWLGVTFWIAAAAVAVGMPLRRANRPARFSGNAACSGLTRDPPGPAGSRVNGESGPAAGI
jgi:hypothetical protein